MGNATSDASSASVVVGRPGNVGKPVVQNGQTSLLVSFNPGGCVVHAGRLAWFCSSALQLHVCVVSNRHAMPPSR